MVNRNLIRSLENDAELEAAFEEATVGVEEAIEQHVEAERSFELNSIIDGRIIRIDDDSALVDVGFKSEGTIPLNEWDPHEDPPEVGQNVQVLIEEMEDELGRADDPYGMVSLSKRKADKIREWQRVMSTVNEGQVITGMVKRKIKGGLLVDIGVNVFLPASQVDIRRPHDIGDYIDRYVQCEVLKSMRRVAILLSVDVP
jgi:small subunit ribosomal protein S1